MAHIDSATHALIFCTRSNPGQRKGRTPSPPNGGSDKIRGTKWVLREGMGVGLVPKNSILRFMVVKGTLIKRHYNYQLFPKNKKYRNIVFVVPIYDEAHSYFYLIIFLYFRIRGP